MFSQKQHPKDFCVTYNDFINTRYATSNTKICKINLQS